MPITRKFFDWNTPALPQVVEWLCRTRLVLGHVDLSDVLLVVPGGRAGRRFLELLTDATSGRNAPPEVITLGQLPEYLYEPQKPFASDLTQRLAWAEALRSLTPSSIAALLRNPPDPSDLDRWLALGSMLARHHTELAADGLNFKHVLDHGNELPGFDEHDRWSVLCDVQERYLTLLDDLNLWDQQTARLVAIDRRECRTDREILLLAAVDMNRAPRKMLDLVADQVTALIHAPETLADHFDEHGCLIPEAWESREIDLPTDRVRVVDGPAEQAAEAAYLLAELEGAFRADEITIGVADEQLIPHLRRTLEECGVPSRWVVERPLPETPPATLLEAVADYLEDDRVSRFAALVRHPDLAAWLDNQGFPAGWLTQLDRYAADHCQPRFGEWLGRPKEFVLVRPVYEAVRALLSPLIAPPRPLGEWSEFITDVLLTVFGQVEFDEESASDRISLAACRLIHKALEDQRSVPDSLAGSFTAADAIRLALESAAGGTIPPPPDESAVQLLGWLELPLDDAPVAVVTSFNEGFVPGSLNADLFLPNSLRQRLGVLDNTRRYARDAYALSTLLHSRQRVSLIVGRRDAAGDPLKPSRLLFASDPETVARRVLQFYGSARTTTTPRRPQLPTRLRTEREGAAFRIPRPVRCPKPESLTTLSVTAFRDYLACPYRFYLSRVLALEAVEDGDSELTGLSFGNLIHEVLKEFGLSEIRGSSNADEIAAFVEAELDRQSGSFLGGSRLPAVQLQVEQVRQRLRAFAVTQAELADFGWEIRYVEQPDHNDGVPFDLGDGREVRLRGRIDRIDFNPRINRWMIIDYKTGARGETPDEIHRRKEEWIDLQLPLYLQIARPLGVSGEVGMAYLVLPQDSTGTRLLEAEWSAEVLASAHRLAQEVGRKILDEVFWPPRDSAELRYPAAEFERICHGGTFDGERLLEVVQ